jgi:hypothetical protein
MERTGRSGKEQKDGVGTEEGRRPTGVPTPSAASSSGVTAERDPEVSEHPIRRRFTAEYKQRILEEADRCRQRGELGTLLRREGLYSSHLTTWQKQRDQGMLEGLTPKKRGRKAKRQDPLVEENRRLRRETERLQLQLKKAETIIEFQKKLSEILGIPMESPPLYESDE